jgi:hypothetical protein
MKNQLFFLICLLLQLQLFAQTSAINYSNYANSQKVDNEAWKAMKSSISVSFANSDLHFAKEKIPTIAIQKKWEATAWKGEKINTQILVWSGVNVPKMSVEIVDLVNKKGDAIKKEQIKAGFVRYVMTDTYKENCAVNTPNQGDSSLVADVIDVVSTGILEANSVQPIWVSIDVPNTLSAGVYTGNIIVNADKKHKLRIQIKVLEQQLPPASDWAFDLDYWQHPSAIARVHNVPLWSAAHYEKMRPYYEMLAKAGQKSITTSIIHEPWNHQTYDDFPSLIKWTKKKDNTWQYDYTLFDKYVNFVMECGIRDRICCYTLIPWKLSFQYYDEALGRDTTLNATPNSEAYALHWTRMLTDFTKHLKEKGWFGKTSISMDERAPEDMKAVIKLIKSVDPTWKITLAGGYSPEIEAELYDFSITFGWKLDSKVIEKRKSQGKPCTFYTCCVEAFPNGFTFSPPAESAWLGWFAAAQGYTGYLRWAYNSWPANPLKDSRFRAWSAGDTYQVYPGPLSSIRFEKLIEGIQDFEKIRLLRKAYKSTNNTKKLQDLDLILANFDHESLKNKSATEMISKAKNQLNNLIEK